jgi:tetratricopeptide (TPR) repeat protein
MYCQKTRAIRDRIRALNSGEVSDSVKIKLSLTLASEFTGYKKDSALYYVTNAKTLLRDHPSEKDLADAEYIEALIRYSASEFVGAQLSLNQCIKLTKSTGDKNLLSKAYNLLGAIHFNLGNYSEAMDQYDNKLFIAVD